MSTVQANVTGRKVHAVEPEELIPSNEAAKLLRQRPQTLAMWRSEGRGPVYVKIGRQVFYTPSALRQYASDCVVVPTAVAGGAR